MAIQTEIKGIEMNPQWLENAGLPKGLHFKSAINRVYKNDKGYGFYDRKDKLIEQFTNFRDAFWRAYNSDDRKSKNLMAKQQELFNS